MFWINWGKIIKSLVFRKTNLTKKYHKMFIVIAKGKTRKYQGEYDHKMKLNPYLPQPMAQKKKKERKIDTKTLSRNNEYSV